MTSFRRYAVFWAPPRGSALARFGARWLGWDAEAGLPVPQLEVPGLPAPVPEITATPRRYGFHGTLKPPFRLAEATDFAALDGAVAGLAAKSGSFRGAPPTLTRIGRFIALVPSARSSALDALAERCVSGLDTFRAPSGEAELARRREHGLTSRQEEHLARWGYPYVLDEFRFHLTLTGGLAPEEGAAVFEALARLTEPFCAEPLPFDEICLFGEDEDGGFHVLKRYALTG
jgi:putative phosphonate metabolism protein